MSGCQYAEVPTAWFRRGPPAGLASTLTLPPTKGHQGSEDTVEVCSCTGTDRTVNQLANRSSARGSAEASGMSNRGAVLWERLALGLNFVVLAIVLGVLFRREGPARLMLEQWGRDRRLRAVLLTIWPKLAAAPRLAPGDTEIRLVEFSDYQCPYCRGMWSIVDSLAADGIAVSYLHLPLPQHVHAAGAARASICAEVQRRFREMHARLFATTEWQRDGNWVREAVEAGVPDTAAFRACLHSDGTTTRLESDMALAARLGVNGTPAFFTSTDWSMGLQSRRALLALVAVDGP